MGPTGTGKIHRYLPFMPHDQLRNLMMKTRRAVILIAVLCALSLFAAPTAARQHDDDGPLNKAKCEAEGGVWVNDQGQKSCNKITEVELDDVVVDDSVDLGEFVATVQTSRGRAVIERLTQLGNVGAPGTVHTQAEEIEIVSEYVEIEILACFKKLPAGRLQAVPVAPCESAIGR